MRKITLDNGLKLSIDEDVMDDMELLEALAEADGGNILAYPRLVNLMLGSEQKAKLYDKLRGKNGRVSTKATGEVVVEIIRKLGEDEEEGKNS